MRTTVNLPADLHNAVTSIAAHSRKSMNQTVADLIRRALAQPATPVDAVANALVRVDKATGLPTVRSPRPCVARGCQGVGGRLMPAAKQPGGAKPSAATLLDGNVLVALVDEAHVHHAQARS